MSIGEIIYNATLNPEEMQEKLLKIPTYIKRTGGGILWAIAYWIVCGMLVYEIKIGQDKLDFVTAGLILFIGIGIVLTLGIIRHLQFLERYRKAVSEWLEEQNNALTNEASRLASESNKRVGNVITEYSAKLREAEARFDKAKLYAQDLHGMYKKYAAQNPAYKWPSDEPWDNWFRFIKS